MKKIQFSSLRHIFQVVAVICVLFISGALRSASTPARLIAQDPPQGAVPVFRAGADLVLVNVTVRDNKGAPRAGLKSGDFTLFEDGRPQVIQLFAEEDILSEESKPLTDLTVNRLKAQKVDPNTPAIPSIAADDLSADEEARNKRWVILFFDRSSLAQEDLLRAHHAAVDYIDKRMTAGDLLAAMAYSTELDVLQDFTQDKEALKGALDRLVRTTEDMGGEPTMSDGAGSGTAVEGRDGETEDSVDNSLLVDEAEWNLFNSDRRLQAIETVAEWLAPYPEKKALIHYSGGHTRTGQENQAQLHATVEAANRANMAIYTVDARGLTAVPAGGDASKSVSGGSRRLFDGRAMAGQAAARRQSQDTLWALSSDTGGRSFLENNDLSPVFSKVREDLSRYYVVGYYSDNDRRDGRFRQIKVKVNLPGAQVHHRPGYYALKEFHLMTRDERDRHLQEAAELDSVPPDFPLALSTGMFRVMPKLCYVPVSLRFPAVNIPFLQKKNLRQTDFDFLGQVKTMEGKMVSFVKNTVRLDLSDPVYQEMAAKSIQYDAGFYLPPGNYRIKFVARENVSGRLGIFERSLEITKPSADRLELSSILLGSRLQPLAEETAGVKVQTDRDLKEWFRDPGRRRDPLVVQQQRLVPNVTQVFRSGDHLYALFEIYGAQPDTAGGRPSVMVSLVLWRGDRRVREMAGEEIKTFDDPESRRMTCRFHLPLTAFPAGTYDLQVTAADQLSGRYAWSRTRLAIR